MVSAETEFEFNKQKLFNKPTSEAPTGSAPVFTYKMQGQPTVKPMYVPNRLVCTTCCSAMSKAKAVKSALRQRSKRGQSLKCGENRALFSFYSETSMVLILTARYLPTI